MLLHCFMASMISDGKSAANFIYDPLYMMSPFSLATFKILFLVLSFNSLAIIDVLMWISLNLILFRICSVFWMHRWMSCITFEKFVFISSNIFSSCLSFLLLRLSWCICWHIWLCPTGFVHFSLFFFLSDSSDWIISISLSSSFLLLVHISCQTSLVDFLFQLLYFSAPEYLFGFIL